MNEHITATPGALARPLTRRGAVATIGAVSVAGLWARAAQAQSAAATPPASDGVSATPASTEEGTEIGHSAMPDWLFTAVSMKDPYGGTMTKPTSVPSGTRVVSCQIIITNRSDQPLQFTITDIRLRDTDGAEYRAGDYLGTEPRVVSQNLPDGERTRGWVWFGIPEKATPASIVFIAPPPVLRVEFKK